jgi:hypothetical protein
VPPTLAIDLARLLVANASRAVVEGRLAREPDAPALEPILALGERARKVGAGEDEIALALGLLRVLGARGAKETFGA